MRIIIHQSGLRRIFPVGILRSCLISSIAKNENAFRNLRVLPMPKLSPTMEKGKIEKWNIKEGDFVQSHQLVVEVSTAGLTKFSNEDGSIDHMEIELIEDMLTAKLLAKPGDVVDVGKPIAIFCDSESYLQYVADLKFNAQSDMYDPSAASQMALWQGYRKE